jgi:hypothetical protein
MTDDLAALNLEDDYQEVLAADCAARWMLWKPAALEVWATVYPARAPSDLFQARLLWRVYPGEPPSVKFRDPALGRLDLTSAWPQVRGFRPTSFDTCVNWSLEGFALHPEWRSDLRFRWDDRGNVLLKVLTYLQNELDDHYQGRHP